MSFTVVEQYLHHGSPVRTAEGTLDGNQTNRNPGWELERSYWAWYVPKADIQTYVDKIEELLGADFPLSGDPVVRPMFGLAGGFFYIFGRGKKRYPSMPVDDTLTSYSPFVFYGIPVLEDDFAALDTDKWDVPTNAGNAASVSGGKLVAASSNTEYGWLVTKLSYPFAGTRMRVTIRQSNVSGRVQMSPTRSLTAVDGLHSAANMYEIELGTLGGPAFRVVKRTGGVLGTPSGWYGPFTVPYQLCFFLEGSNIVVATRPNSNAPWTTQWSEAFSLSGVLATDDFYFALGAEDTPADGEVHYDDFSLDR